MCHLIYFVATLTIVGLKKKDLKVAALSPDVTWTWIEPYRLQTYAGKLFVMTNEGKENQHEEMQEQADRARAKLSVGLVDQTCSRKRYNELHVPEKLQREGSS